jgi:nicotinamidase-related amidase
MLLDFQNDFLADRGRMPIARSHAQSAVAAANAALTEARAAGIVIFAVGNAFRRRDWLSNAFRRNAALDGSWGAQWDTRVPIDGLPYFRKWTSDAFANPELELWLRAKGVSDLTIAGLFAKACVMATARSALARGFSVRVLAEASGCSSDASRASALAQLARAGVAIARTEPAHGS